MRTESSVTSRDGTSIGYYRIRTGPGLILVHGAGQTAESFRTLATDLSQDFTVYVPDRRGRGMSPTYGDFHGLRSEIEDLAALLDATGARNVFGLSAGAVIAIETARSRTDIRKLALYEPPLSFNGVVHGSWAPRYERQLAAGKPGSALVAVLKGTRDRTAFRLVPGFLLGPALDFIIQRTAERPVPPGTFSPRDIIPTLHYDRQTVADADGPLDRFAGLRCQVLLLSGSRSARNLIASVDGLRGVLQNAERVTLRGAGHTAADNGKEPRRVAAELRRFFGDTNTVTTERPTMLCFEWSSRSITPAMRAVPSDLWCVRDAFSELMGWPPGSDEWSRFIEEPNPDEMERLTDHLGLKWCDPDRQPETFATFTDHPGISVYAFHTHQMSHVMYQPHLRHLRSLPPQYGGIPAELFRIIADIRQQPRECARCQIRL